MIDDPYFVPFIRTTSWSGVADCFTGPLLKDSSDLVIAYGVLGKNSVTYLTQAGRKGSELTDVEIHIRAIRNMLKIPGRPNWQEHKLGGESYVLREGNELVASGVLNAKGLLRLNDFLQVPTYYVGLPSLFTMVASTHAGLLTGIVKGLYDEARDGGSAITDRLMVVTKGQLSSYTAPEPSIEAPAPATREAQVLVLTQGLAGIWTLMEHAKGGGSDGTPGPFLSSVKRRLGNDNPPLMELIIAAEGSVAEAGAALRRTKESMSRIDALASTMRTALGVPSYQQLARALVAAAIDIGQSGTGFFGIGRKLPETLRVPIRALNGVLGITSD